MHLFVPDLNVWVTGLNCRLPFPRGTVMDAKVLGSINHDAMGIERRPSPAVGGDVLFLKVVRFVGLNVFHQNGNVRVTVGS